MDIKKQLEILTKGSIEIVPEGGLLEKLKLADKEKRPLFIKLGADPSAPDIHLGHTVLLRKLRDFQLCGHKAIFVIGDFTGMIGDPSGKSKTRKILSKDEIKINAKTYKDQVFKILDPELTQITFNSKWTAPMNFLEVLELTRKYTVAQMLERDDFQKRYKKGERISISEFLYSLIQGYDSVHLNADIELGGSDQKFNLLVGRSLQKEFKQEPQVCLMMPLLEGLDGVSKMSKSLNNYISINDTPKDMFGKIMSINDQMIIKYFTLLTDYSLYKIKKISDSIESKENPKKFKMLLAKEIVTNYYQEEIAKKAFEEFNRIFSQKKLPDEIPEYKIKENKIWLVKFLTESGLSYSNSESRRLINSGAVYVNNKRLTDENIIFELEKGMIIKVGKRRFLKLI